ncbi:MAG: TonB-dependent receptor plug domain-containing protein [Deltaproteobacteria bacterium]|nr:TonB-dependent receptor plug domain-containing protein [Deltaproteobacteria bacterium]
MSGNSGVDFSSIPINSIERIEIIRGGGTAAFGGDAIGGVINILTKKAKEGRTIEIKETGGSFTTFKSAESLAERRKKWGLVLSHTHSQSHGDYTFKSASTNLAGTSVGGGVIFKRLHNGFISEDLLTKFDVTAHENLKFEVLNNF